MAEKTIQPVPVEADEAALASLGWTAQDVRARLVTETRGGAVMQRVAVAGAVRFRATEWTEHFSESGYAPRVLLTLNRRGGTSLPRYGQAVAALADIAAKRPIRFTETSEPWNASVPIAPDELEVRVTGYDLDRIGCSFGLPGARIAALPVTVRDESSWPSLRVKTEASAEVTRDRYDDQLCVRIGGVVELGSVGELLADRAEHEQGPFDRLHTIPELAVPGFVVEITDDSDFLLAKRTIEFGGVIRVEETMGAPHRPPRFMAGFRTGSASRAGTPAQVLVRVLDAADIRSI